jgi:hypothetical protein
MRTMRLLAAGATITGAAEPPSGYHIIIKTVRVQRVTTRVMHEMMTHGWIAFSGARNRWELTPLGRDLVDVKTFVRAFADAQGAA